MSLNRIRQQFAENIEHSMKAAELLPETLVIAGNRLVASLLDGGKIFSAGSASGAQFSMLFAGLLLQGQGQRPPLPAWDLTGHSATCDNTSGSGEAAALQALGQRGDILLLIQPDTAMAGQLIQTAHDRDIAVILISPAADKRNATQCSGQDIPVIVPADSTQRAGEVTLLIIHALCDHIEQQLFGDIA